VRSIYWGLVYTVVRPGPEFDHVGDARNPQAMASNRQGREAAHAATFPGVGLMGHVVQQTARR
jgi:hypothetical protein